LTSIAIELIYTSWTTKPFFLILSYLRKKAVSITIRFTPGSMNAVQYDECIKRLEQAGAGAQTRRLYHICYGKRNEL